MNFINEKQSYNAQWTSKTHFSLHCSDENNTELTKLFTKIYLFLLNYFYSIIGTKF